MLVEGLIAAGLFIGGRARTKATSPAAGAVTNPQINPPTPPARAPGGIQGAATQALSDAAYSAAIARNITSGNIGGAIKQVSSNPLAAVGVGVRTALAGVAGPIAYLAPFLGKHPKNPATPQDQRERAALTYWWKWGPTKADNDQAYNVAESKKQRYGAGWGWTPGLESSAGGTRPEDWGRGDPNEMRAFMRSIGMGYGDMWTQADENGVHSEVIRMAQEVSPPSGWMLLFRR